VHVYVLVLYSVAYKDTSLLQVQSPFVEDYLKQLAAAKVRAVSHVQCVNFVCTTWHVGGNFDMREISMLIQLYDLEYSC